MNNPLFERSTEPASPVPAPAEQSPVADPATSALVQGLGSVLERLDTVGKTVSMLNERINEQSVTPRSETPSQQEQAPTQPDPTPSPIQFDPEEAIRLSSEEVVLRQQAIEAAVDAVVSNPDIARNSNTKEVREAIGNLRKGLARYSSADINDWLRENGASGIVNTVIGNLFNKGLLTPNRSPDSPNPVQPPVSNAKGDSSAALEMFEQMYGKPLNEAQASRIKTFGGIS